MLFKGQLAHKDLEELIKRQTELPPKMPGHTCMKPSLWMDPGPAWRHAYLGKFPHNTHKLILGHHKSV